jgi:hypothetical protein
MSALLEALRTRQPLATANLRGMQDRYEAPPEQDDALDVDAQTDIAIELIGRACRARDAAATADLLREAAKLLVCIADEVEAA